MKKINREIRDKIEEQYIYGIEKNGKIHFPSYQELADIFQCCKGTISNYATKNQWEEKREIFKNKTLNKINAKKELIKIDEKSERVADTIVDFDIQCFNIARDGIMQCKNRLSMMEITDEQGTSALEKISFALEKFQKVGKNAIGEVLPDETINITIGDEKY